MNSQYCSTNAQKTIPPEYIPPMSLHRFCEITGLSKVSAWRYEKSGWLRTHLIANRRYILAADVAEFNRRFASDEFAGTFQIFPAPARPNESKQSSKHCCTLEGLPTQVPKTGATLYFLAAGLA